MLNFKSIKTQLILYLAAFALFIAITKKDLNFCVSMVIAIAAAVLFDAIFVYIKTRGFRLTESSIITGMIIGYVLSSDESWWKFAAAALFAVSSKHIIVINKKHIFNPAAFGIFSAIILFAAATQWKGTYQWHILLPAGLYFTYKIRKMELLAGYIVVALSLWGIQALIQRVNIIYIFGYLSYFFIFIMLIEPKTTPSTRMGKILFGGIVAGTIFILTELGVRFDVELCGLLLGNTTVPLLNKLKLKRKGA